MNTIKTENLQDYSLTKADLEYFNNFWPNMAKAWNNGDREPYIIGHENSIYMPPNSQTFTNPADIRSFVERYPEHKADFFDFKVMGNQGLVAVYAKFVGKNMDGELLDKGKFIALFSKITSGKWNMTHAIWNSDLPVSN